MKLLDTVIEYLRAGLRPIPLRHDGVCGKHWKEPDSSKLPQDPKTGKPTWTPYQTTPPTELELEKWFENDEQANVGSVIPQGVLIVDFDGGEELSYTGAKQAEAMLVAAGVILPENAPRVKTGNGYQVYLSTPVDFSKLPGEQFLSNNGSKPFVEILTNGSYGILPPSVHFTGRRYEWVVELGPFPPAPESLLRLIEKKAAEKKEETKKDPDWVEKALMGANSGSRNNTCTKLAGYFIAKGLPESLVKNILESTYAKKCNPQMLSSEVESCVRSIANTDARNHPKEEVPEGEPRHISSVGKALLKAASDGPPKFYPTSFSKLDFYLGGGLVGGELVYLGARPGVGKTAMALQIARHVASMGTSILIVSREMNNRSLMARMIAQTGAVTASEMRRMNFQPDRRVLLDQAVSELSTLPIFMTDKLYRVDQVADVVAKSKAKEQGLLVIIDYLQLMKAGDSGAERRIQVETVSQELKKMALENDVPVLCMSSLSRAFDKKNPKPTTDSLRESGALEHDADVIILLHRGFQEANMECQIAKNRNGHAGSLNLVFEPEFLAFSCLEESREDGQEEPIATERPKPQEMITEDEHWNH